MPPACQRRSSSRFRLVSVLPNCTRHNACRLQNKDSTGDDKLTAKALGEYYTKMTEDFPIVSIEDGFDQVCVVFRHIFRWNA